MGHTITACLVVYNEELLIRRCLESLKGTVNEFVVVHDGPCTDRTLDICREYTEKIFVRPHIGEGEPHRVFSFEQATGEWVLQIDADEVLSPELRASLRDLVNRANVDLYCFLWPYTDGHRPLTLGIQHPYRPCLARRSKMYFYGLVGQVIQTYGTVRKVPLVLEHRPGYDNFTWQRFRTKWIPWIMLHAKWLWRDPQEIPCYNVKDKDSLATFLKRERRFPLLRLPVYAIFQFAYQIYKGMWRIGLPGLKIAAMSAAYNAGVRFYTFKYRPRRP